MSTISGNAVNTNIGVFVVLVATVVVKAITLPRRVPTELKTSPKDVNAVDLGCTQHHNARPISPETVVDARESTSKAFAVLI
jgi:hypothetical protein